MAALGARAGKELRAAAAAMAEGGRRWKRRWHGRRGQRRGRAQEEEGEAAGRGMASGVREAKVPSEGHVIASRMTSDPA